MTSREVARQPQLPIRFELERELARGGMGVVYAARDQLSGTRVALKRLLPGAPAPIATLFEREFHVLSALDHPRIIRVYEYGVDEHGPYYTMELLEGADLRDLAPLDVLTACRYLRDVASSLALLHARRLLHRDVSARNVRTTPDGCKLIDFGALTSFGFAEDVVGTPAAIAPESVFGQELDQRTDLYSLGTLAYWLLTGRHAYRAQRMGDLAQAWTEKPLPPSHYSPQVPPELDALVLSLVNTEVLSRPVSAAQVIDRLNAIGRLEPDRDERVARAYFVGNALVERDAELQRVSRRIERVKAGRGAAVFVDSEPGIGKSRFLAEVSLKAQLAGLIVLRVDAAAHVGAGSVAKALLRSLQRSAPDVAERVGENLIDAARELPLCMAIDNLELADSESSALLVSLARSTRERALLFITTCALLEPAEASPAIRAIRDASTGVRLRELSEAGVAALVCAAFGDVPHSRRTANRLFAATDGNPQHCSSLMQHWVSLDIVSYEGGTWMLPLEIPDSALVGVERVTRDRLARCSDEARALAQALSVLGRPAPLELCVALAVEGSTRPRVVTALEELVQAEVLSAASGEYRFRREAYRAAVLAALSVESRSELHGRIARALLALRAVDLDATLEAGEHVIASGRESEGAELIARAARAGLDDRREPVRMLARHSRALEAALEIFRRQKRTNLELLRLLVPLVVASYDVSYEFAFRHGYETIARLERALGLPASDARAPEVPADQVLAALASAPVLDEGEERTPDTPDVVLLVTWLIRSVATMIAVAGAAIDHQAEERLIAALRPFRALGPAHPAAIVHRYGVLLLRLTQDEFREVHRGWSEMLEEIDSLPIEPVFARRMKIGAILGLGILESQLDDDSALARAEALESTAYAQRLAAANQLRFLYHGFRGELEVAEKYRDRLEEYAMKEGAAWQVETWSTCTMVAVYGNTVDPVGNKRCLEQLGRLRKTIPALELYYQRALATQYLVTGEPARALEIFEKTLEGSVPRERVAWSLVRGAMARAHNDLGQHERAFEICEDAIARAEDDRDFVAMNLLPRLERVRARVGLGHFDAAKLELDELFEHHAASNNPMTRGSLHKSRAELALARGDLLGFAEDLAAMESWFQRTQNPSLVAQCDKLRQLATRRASGSRPAPNAGLGFLVTDAHSVARSVLANCYGPEERQLRALELVAGRAGGREAWLFTLDANATPIVMSRLGVGEPPAAVISEVMALFEQMMNDCEETSYMADAKLGSGKFAVAATLPESPYRLFPLTIARGSELLLGGAIAVVAQPGARGISYKFLQDIAAQLYLAGDITSVRLVG